MNNSNGNEHQVVGILAFIGMITAMAWRVYIGERHTPMEWVSVAVLSLIFSAGALYFFYPRFEGDYGSLILASMVAGAGTTVYLSALIEMGRWGTRKFRRIMDAIEASERDGAE